MSSNLVFPCLETDCNVCSENNRTFTNVTVTDSLNVDGSTTLNGPVTISGGTTLNGAITTNSFNFQLGPTYTQNRLLRPQNYTISANTELRGAESGAILGVNLASNDVAITADRMIEGYHLNLFVVAAGHDLILFGNPYAFLGTAVTAGGAVVTFDGSNSLIRISAPPVGSNVEILYRGADLFQELTVFTRIVANATISFV